MKDIRTNTAELQDQLTGVLIGIARAVDGNEHLITDSTDQLVGEALAAALAEPDAATLSALLGRADEEKRKLVPGCYTCASPCGKNNNYDLGRLQALDEDVRALKLLLLCGIRSMAAHACRAAAAGHADRELSRFFYYALFAIGEESFGVKELLPVAAKFGQLYPHRGAAPDIQA